MVVSIAYNGQCMYMCTKCLTASRTDINKYCLGILTFMLRRDDNKLIKLFRIVFSYKKRIKYGKIMLLTSLHNSWVKYDVRNKIAVINRFGVFRSLFTYMNKGHINLHIYLISETTETPITKEFFINANLTFIRKLLLHIPND